MSRCRRRAALGYIQWKLNNTTDAIADFERAVQLQCNDFFNLQNLGMLYRDTGQDEKALNMLEAALAVADCNPNDPYAKSCNLLAASTDPNANPAKTTRVYAADRTKRYEPADQRSAFRGPAPQAEAWPVLSP